MKNMFFCNSRPKANFRGIKQTNLAPSERRACLNISIDQRDEQGEKLAAIIDKANRSFGHFDLMLCDSLNRFNLMIESGMSPELAEVKTIETGDEWIRKNQQYLEHLSIPGRVIRWNEWRAHDRFEDIQRQVAKLVNTDPKGLHIFTQVAQEYCQRKKLKINDRALALSIDYLIEECAIITLWAMSGYHYELYPSTRSPVSTYTLSHFSNTELENPLHFLRVEFKKTILAPAYAQQKTPQHLQHIPV